MLVFVKFFLLLQTFSFATPSCLQLKSFADFLEYNHLSHGIIIMCHDDGRICMEELRRISTKHYIKIDRTGVVGVTAFKDLFYYGAPKVGISLNIECQSKAVSILEAASGGNFFNSSQAWFILTDSAATGLSTLADKMINIDADITLGVRVRVKVPSSHSGEEEDILRLYDVYKVCHQCGSSTALQSAVKGSWSTSKGMEILPEFWKPMVQRRRNFTGITLKGSIAITAAPKDTPIDEYIESFNNKHLDAMQRKTYHLLKLLEDVYNFRFKVVITDAWGVQQDGNWTGAMGTLVSGEVALSLTSLRFTQQRILAVRFLSEVHVEMCVIRFLFRHPRRPTVRNIFLQPFTPAVWYTVLGVIAAGVLLLAITMRHEFQHNQSSTGGCSENKLDFFTLIILEAIFLQGPSQMFQFISTRTLIISICIFAVMLYQFYSAFIVGSLLADVPRTIVNMPALFNSSLDIGMEDIIYNYEFFMNTSNQMAKDIFVHRIMRSPRTNILPLQDGLARVGRGGYAYFVAVGRAYRILKEQLTESQFCDLQEVEMEAPVISCPAVPHGSPFKEHFASAVLKFRETGLLIYHNKLWSIEKPQCSPEMMEKDTAVDMEHFIPALGFLAVAMLTSLMIFGVELLVQSLGVMNGRQGRRPQRHRTTPIILKKTQRKIPSQRI